MKPRNLATSEILSPAARQTDTAPLASRTIIAADLFCGGGGTSTGMKQALAKRGLTLRLVAVNHWAVAIDTHSANHPEAAHFCQDLATLRPLAAVPGGILDLLVASPTCTFHSRARGGRPTSDQQRMDPWHVVTWLTELRVTRILIENVPEFVKWGPVDYESGRPLKEREGEFFQAWLRTLTGIGFAVDWRIVNCAHFGDATTRQRFFLIGRSDGIPLRWAEETHGRHAGDDRKKWRCARDIIDWRRKGRDALGRDTPLKPNTLRRIMVGVERHFGPLSPVYVAALEVELARSIARWGDTTTTKAGRRRQPKGPTDTASTDPAVVELRGTAAAHSVDAPVPGITAGGTHLGVVAPEVMPVVGANRTNNNPVSVDHPVPTIVTSGNLFLVQPALERADGFVFPVNQGHGRTRGSRSVAEPLPTLVTRESLGVAEPILFHVNHQGEARIGSLDEPIPTATSKRGLGLATPMIAPYYGSGSGETCKSVDEPLDSVTTKARFALAEPAIEPAQAFLSVYNGDKDGRSRAARPVTDPVPTITAEPRLALCQPQPIPAPAEDLRRLADARRLAVIDGHLYLLKLPFRMLANEELASAMSFPEGYHFTGTKEEVTRQIGNAVPVYTAAAHIDALFEE